MRPSPRKALLIVLDGLRLDMVRPDLTPHLCAFQARGVVLGSHRAIFPSDTRANTASLITGSPPGLHGLPGNTFFDASLDSRRIIDTSVISTIDPLTQRLGGRFYLRPTLGEVLARHGRSLAVLGTASEGTTRVIQPDLTLENFFCLSGHDLNVAWPADEARTIVERFGALPDREVPDTQAIRYVVDVFLHHVWPNRSPDLTVLWLNEPDTSYHACGVGSPESIEAIKEADVQLGRLFEWAKSDAFGDMQIAVLSDHGHIDIRGRVDVAQTLRDAGFKVGTGLGDDSDVVITQGCPSRISLRRPDRGLIHTMAQTLMGQPWCGHVFTRGKGLEGPVAGTFASSLVEVEGERSPDMWVTLRSEDDENRYGWPGWCDSVALPRFKTMHGGLHRREMENVAILGGSQFATGIRTLRPTSACDIAPTLLHVLGLPPEESWTGRIVTEACGAQDEPGDEVVFSTTSGERRAHLAFRRACDRLYLDHGWIEPRSP